MDEHRQDLVALLVTTARQTAVVMMLVPRDVDAGLFGGIARALAARGDRHDRYREIIGRYERAPDGGVRLRVERGLRADGSEVPIGLLFDLTAITRLAGAAPRPTRRTHSQESLRALMSGRARRDPRGG